MLSWSRYREAAASFTLPGRWILPAMVPLSLAVSRAMVGVDVPLRYMLATMGALYVFYAELEFWRLRRSH